MDTQTSKLPALFWVVILAGGALSILTYRVAANSERNVAEAEFAADALERAVLIRNKFDVVTSTLQDLGSLYAVSDVVTGGQFSRFVNPILAREPALQALSWNPVVNAADRVRHEQNIREQGQPGYQITERLPDGQLVRASSRDHYVVVANIEPLTGNENALGFDVNSEPTRRRALEKARDEGSLAIATPIRLVQASSESTGALVFLPSYKDDLPASTAAHRRRAIEGYLVAVVDTPRLIAQALSGLGPTPGRLTLGISSPALGDATLFDSGPQSGAVEAPAPRFGSSDPPRYETVFPWGGHEVRLKLDADGSFVAGATTWVPASLALAVFAVTGLAASIVRTYSNRAAKVAREVSRRTAELRAANEVLREEVARRRSAEARLARSRRDLEEEVARRTTELRATSNQLRLILESEPECVKIVTADGLLEDMNAAGLGMIEADSIDEARGADVYALVADEYRDAFIEFNQRVINGERGTLEFEIVGLKGTRRRVETHAAPLVNPAGETRHLAITRDITGKKEIEEERTRLEAQVRHSQKLESIGVLAGGIAHDFNNMLQVIIGNTEYVLQRQELSSVTRESLEASCEAALHAAKVCDQMLTYAGRSLPVVKPLRLTGQVSSIMTLLESSLSRNTRLELHADEADDLVRGDEGQLSQVVMNLITNAAESIGDNPGHIELRISRTAVEPGTAREGWFGGAPKPGDYVALEVIDDGCGMDEAVIERMFDPFFTTKFTGRGLGLSATLGIVQSHAGFVRVASRPGEGTHVTVLLPSLADSVSQADEAPSPAVSSIDATVLVVDDDRLVLDMGDAMLRHLGCRTLLASDGQEALERFRQAPDAIDAVLLDVTMPRMNGNETCAVMRSLRPDIPVIFCSGYANDAVSADKNADAFTAFLHKPYRRRDLVRVLAEALAA